MLQCSYRWQNLKQWTQWRLFCVWKGLLALNLQQNCTGLVTNIQPTMLVHYLTLSGFWIGWEGQSVLTELSTNTGHACSVKMALVKLDPWDFLMLFSICLPMWMWTVLSVQHRTTQSWGVTLDTADFWPTCLFDVRLCVHGRCRVHALGLLCEAFSL